MPSAKGVTAWVEIEGSTTPEYAVEHGTDENGNPTATCWIASEAGKTFTINWRIDSYKKPIIGRVYVDSQQVTKKIIISPRQLSCQSRGWKPTRDTRTLFQFGLLSLTDKEDTIDTADPQDLGQLKITVYKGREKVMQPHRHIKRYAPALVPRTVNEKSKKGLVHHIQNGPTVPERSSNKGSSVRYVEYGTSIITFLFKYRPLDVLRANGLVANEVRTKAEPGDVIEISDGDTEELGEEEKRLEARLAVIRRAKRPAMKTDPDTKPVVLNGMVIDLT